MSLPQTHKVLAAKKTNGNYLLQIKGEQVELTGEELKDLVTTFLMLLSHESEGE